MPVLLDLCWWELCGPSWLLSCSGVVMWPFNQGCCCSPSIACDRFFLAVGEGGNTARHASSSPRTAASCIFVSVCILRSTHAATPAIELRVQLAAKPFACAEAVFKILHSMCVCVGCCQPILCAKSWHPEDGLPVAQGVLYFFAAVGCVLTSNQPAGVFFSVFFFPKSSPNRRRSLKGSASFVAVRVISGTVPPQQALRCMAVSMYSLVCDMQPAVVLFVELYCTHMLCVLRLFEHAAAALTRGCAIPCRYVSLCKNVVQAHWQRGVLLRQTSRLAFPRLQSLSGGCAAALAEAGRAAKREAATAVIQAPKAQEDPSSFVKTHPPPARLAWGLVGCGAARRMAANMVERSSLQTVHKHRTNLAGFSYRKVQTTHSNHHNRCFLSPAQTRPSNATVQRSIVNDAVLSSSRVCCTAHPPQQDHLPR